ncbi:hypothetical protein P8605_43775, partial [Streptomyces sp. T-3]|nr:hypothetical protein [Streptomyces sp. T-3]
GRRLEFPVTAARGALLRAEISSSALAGARIGREDVWDVSLRPHADAATVPFGKLATDVRNPMDVFTFPRPVLETAAGKRELRPYFTTARELAFKVLDLGD